MPLIPQLKIFLSSPGDVSEERALAQRVFAGVANEFADAVRLEVVIWEHEPVFAHTTFQSQIERPSQCDLVVSILWSRLGTRLPRDFAPSPDQPAPTGTEFELKDALASFAAIGKPNLLIYRKIPGPQVGLGSADSKERIEQYHRLDEFCRYAFYDADGAVTVAHTSFTESDEFAKLLAEHVRRWLHRELQSIHVEDFRPVWRGRSPFRGLLAFEAEHQAIFFGRSEAIAHLVRHIREREAASNEANPHRVLLVQGMSGTGKTSLFLAGLLPLLELCPVEGIGVWLTLTLRPSDVDAAAGTTGMFGALAKRLAERIPALERLGTGPVELARLLATQPEEAAARIQMGLAADADKNEVDPKKIRLFVYVDQLEEVFTLADRSAAVEAVFAALVSLARRPNIWIAGSMRSDFAHQLEAYPAFMACLSANGPYILLPPRPDELAEMIREPARAAGLVWEQRDGVSLDQELLRDATGNPESLPLLEYTLAELYERRDGLLLLWSAYGGGLRGTLVAAAEEVLAGISGDTDAAFRNLMRELVGVGEDGTESRRYAPLSSLPSGSPARELLERMVARRLCVTSDDGNGLGPVARLAHEALVRSWPRAQEWLLKEKSLLRIRDEVMREAAMWEHHARSDGWLGVAPERIATLSALAQSGLLADGPVAEYAARSHARARRNRLLKRSAIAGIAVLAVVASVAGVIATEQRDRARIEAVTSDRTKSFMVSLFHLADPSEGRGSQVTVKEVLDKGANDILTNHNKLSGQHRVRVELLTAMGEAYTGLGLYDPAKKLLAAARAELPAADLSPENRVLTLAASGEALYMAGDYEHAEPLLVQAAALARKTLPADNATRAEALDNLAEDLVQEGRYAEAERLCAEAETVVHAMKGDQGSALARTLDILGSAYFFANDLTQAEQTTRQALELHEKSDGEAHALTGMALNNLGAALYQSGKYSQSLDLYERALPIYLAVYGQEHPEVAVLLNNIGNSALMAGKIDEAEPKLRQALAMNEKFKGSTHDDLVPPLNRLAMIDAYAGRLDQADQEIQRAQAIAQLPNHGVILDQVLVTSADIALHRGRLDQAERDLEKAKQLLEAAHDLKQHPAEAWRYAIWDSVEAELLAARGDLIAASKTIQSALPIIAERFGDGGFQSLAARRRAEFVTTLAKSR